MDIDSICISTPHGNIKSPGLYWLDDKHVSIVSFGLVINATLVDGWRFTIGHGCTLVAGLNSEIVCGEGCTIKAGLGSVVKAGPNAVVRRLGDHSICHIFQDPIHIRLDDSSVGYEVVKAHKVMVDDKEYEISEDNYQSLKSFLENMSTGRATSTTLVNR